MANSLNFKNAKNIKKIIIVSIVSVVIVVVFSIVSLIISSINMNRTSLNYRIFASMEELSHIDSYAIKDLECESDSRLGSKEYEEKYAKQILYNENVYYLYAYKFKDQLDAQRYCLNKVVNPDLDKSFRFSYNETCLWAFYNEYAYCVRGNDYKSFAEFYNFLVKDFTVAFKSQ